MLSSGVGHESPEMYFILRYYICFLRPRLAKVNVIMNLYLMPAQPVLPISMTVRNLIMFWETLSPAPLGKDRTCAAPVNGYNIVA